MTLGPGIQRLLALVLLFGAATTLYAFAIAPFWHWRSGQMREIAQVEALVTRYRGILAQDEALQARMIQLNNEREQDVRGELAGGDVAIAAAELQQYLRNTIEAAGGEIRSLRVLPDVQAGTSVRIGVASQIGIGHEGLRDLLFEIETGTPILFAGEATIRERRARRHQRNGDEPQTAGQLDVGLSVFGYMSVADSQP